MNPVGIDHLSLFGMHPLAFIETAAAAGAETVGIQPAAPAPPDGSAPWSLLGNPALCREVRSRLDDTGLRIGMIDGLTIAPGRSARHYEASLADFARMGVTIGNAVSFDELGRTEDEFALLVELARPHGIRILLETCPVLTIRTLAQGADLARRLGDDVGLVIDTLHVSRTDEAADVALLDPELIGYVQLCDAPAAAPATPELYMDQAMHERQVPGEGELPLAQILAAVPAGVVVSAEVPLRSRRAAGWSDPQCAAAAIAGTRRMLAAAA